MSRTIHPLIALVLAALSGAAAAHPGHPRPAGAHESAHLHLGDALALAVLAGVAVVWALRRVHLHRVRKRVTGRGRKP